MIGAFEVNIIDVGGAIDGEVNVFDVFDTQQELFDIYESLYNVKTGEMKSSVENLIDGFVSSDILYISWLGILPDYRGHNIGLYVIKRLVDEFARDKIAVIRPLPFEFIEDCFKENHVSWKTSPYKDGHPKAKQLSSYYQRVGFKKIRGSPFLLLSGGIILPEIEIR